MSLIKLAGNAFTKRFLNGKLSGEALSKIKNAGMVRSKDTMLDGLHYGTQNIVRQKGGEIHGSGFMNKVIAYSHGGYAQMNSNVKHIGDSPFKFLTPLHSVFTPNQNRANHALAMRHEADEVREAGKGTVARVFNKITPKERKASHKFLKNLESNKGWRAKLVSLSGQKEDISKGIHEVLKSNIGKQVGVHSNLAVLGRESNNVLKLKMHGVEFDKMHKLRGSSGSNETSLINRISGKKYGQDFLTKKDLKKMRNAKPDFETSLIEGFYSGK